MSGNQEDPKNGDHDVREVDEESQDNHGPAKRPEDDKKRDVKIEIELHGQAAEDDRVEKDEPKAAREEEAREFACGFAAQRKISTGSGEKEKDGRAKVRDPAGEEICRGGLREIVGKEGGVGEKVARVIERHDDHDDAAQKIDRFDARALDGREDGLGRFDAGGIERNRNGIHVSAYSSKESPEKERLGTNDRKTGTHHLVLGGESG